MLEVLLVVGVLAALGGFGALFLVAWQTLVTVGAWLVAIGALVGVPTGLLYHIGLYRALRPHGLLPDDWYWRPITLHDRLKQPERRAVLTWCYIGAVGFFVIVAGLVCVAAGTLRLFANQSID